MSRINTNITSMLAARVLNNQTQAQNASLERLSTGLRINSGKDDPAGLIASESLRAESRAISAAIDNARRASTVVNVAEGALGEINSLLLELEDLVDRSANEAGLSADEVAANQLQIDAILDSINRVANTTQFNGKKLLDGSFAYSLQNVDSADLASVRVNAAKIADGGTKSVVVEVTAAAETGRLIFDAAGLGSAETATIQVTGRYGSDQFSFAASTAIADIAAAVNQSTSLTGVSASVVSGQLHFNSTEYGSDAFVSVETIAGTFAVEDPDGAAVTKDFGADVGVLVNGATAQARGLDVSFRSGSLAGQISLTETFGTATGSSNFDIVGGGANFAIAPTLEVAGRESIGLDSVATGSLGNSVAGYLSSLGSGQTNALANKNYAAAQRAVRAAVDQVSTLRGRLGAFQKNTIESSINSLQVAQENVLSAESAIRDTDFAIETSRLTRAQILLTTATQTLALANQAPTAVLSLLR